MKQVEELVERYPCLSECRKSIEEALRALIHCYESGGKTLICGNGGSCADADHIVGELMKSFIKKRPLPDELKAKLIDVGGALGKEMSTSLESPLRAISLCVHNSLNSAFSNDVGADFAYAQQVIGYADENDVFIGISTSGNAKNVIAAGLAAKAVGATTIGMCGKNTCSMDEFFDYVIHAPETETYRIQELHVPIYHALCAAIEDHFFDE